MPTIIITSDPLPVPLRRAAALRLTRWLSRHDTVAGNVVVHFVDHQPNTVFSGGLPVEALGRDAPGVEFASVICHLGPDRDEAFRDALAREIADALGAGDATGLLYLEFRPTRSDHVHVWRHGGMCRADRNPGPAQPSEDLP